MERRVEEEWLDELPVNDPGAAASRRDLHRLNAWMGNARLVAERLRRLLIAQKPASVLEIGAGDGKFMLRVARHLARAWRGTRVLLVDKQSLPQDHIIGDFAQLGWEAEFLQADVLELFRQPKSDSFGTIIANLFLHHFSEAQLSGLFSEVSQRAELFVAVEPRRSTFALTASRMVRVIGCNEVTRHDAPISVRAGFRGGELSAMWPADDAWALQEGPAGCFSHLFMARRRGSACT